MSLLLRIGFFRVTRSPLPRVPVSTTSKPRDIWRRRVRKFLHGLEVFLDDLERRSRHPAEQASVDEVFVGIHFDVVDLGIPGHRGVCREDAGLSLRSVAAGVNISEIDAPLLPQAGSTKYCVRRNPSVASWSSRGVGAPRSSPPPNESRSPYRTLSARMKTTLGFRCCAAVGDVKEVKAAIHASLCAKKGDLCRMMIGWISCCIMRFRDRRAVNAALL